MRKFRLYRKDLPTIEFKREYGLREGGQVAYYKVGAWYFSDHPEEDADLEEAKKGILAHVAWYEFLLNGGLEAATAARRSNEPAQ